MNAGCARKTVRSLDNACLTWAPQSVFTTRRNKNPRLPLPLPLPLLCLSNVCGSRAGRVLGGRPRGECPDPIQTVIHEGITDGAHEWVEDADGERRATGKRLCHVQFGVWIVVVVLVKELHVRVVTYTQPHAHSHIYTAVTRYLFGRGVLPSLPPFPLPYIFRSLSLSRENDICSHWRSLGTTVHTPKMRLRPQWRDGGAVWWPRL